MRVRIGVDDDAGDRGGDASAARRALLAQSCLVRDCTSFGLPEHARVSPRHAEENDRLLEAFGGLRPPW